MRSGEKLVSSAEACKLLGDIDRSTLTRWVQMGRLTPAQKLPGATGSYLFTKAEIERRRKEIAA